MTLTPNRRDICIHSRAPGFRRGTLTKGSLGAVVGGGGGEEEDDTVTGLGNFVVTLTAVGGIRFIKDDDCDFCDSMEDDGFFDDDDGSNGCCEG